jgi:hypothetical protein
MLRLIQLVLLSARPPVYRQVLCQLQVSPVLALLAQPSQRLLSVQASQQLALVQVSQQLALVQVSQQPESVWVFQ